MTTKELSLAQYQSKNLMTGVPAIGSIDAYIHWVNQIPTLNAEEELRFATDFRDHNDLGAARKLVMAHLKFVVHVASGYLGYGLAKADLIQEGTIGLMKAVKRFNPTMGVRLASFAVHWIKAEIHEFVLRNWRIVKIATTKAQRKLFFNLRRAPKKLTWFSRDEVENIAKELSVSPKDVRVMEARIQNQDISFDGHQDEEEESNYKLPAHYLIAETKDPLETFSEDELESKKRASLHSGLARLDQRSLDIIESRWLRDEKATLQSLAAKYGISAERVRQLEESALKKLKVSLAGYAD